MPADISAYNYKILAKGYQVSGDVDSGYRATVPYLLPWSEAFLFADEIFGLSSSTTVGPITYRAPYRFPAASGANLYATSFGIEPCGANGSPLGANKGLSPGEFFTHAIVRVEFSTPRQAQVLSTDDPYNLHQLDPDNPLTVCTQEIRAAGKMETIKDGSFIYDDDEKPVPGDNGIPTNETQLVLTFPRVPYLPWALVRPYLNSLNDAEVLGVGRGELLFSDFTTKVEATQNGLSQQLQLIFSVSPEPGVTWNHLPKPDGTPVLVRRRSDKGAATPRRIFRYKDFTEIFDQLERTEA